MPILYFGGKFHECVPYATQTSMTANVSTMCLQPVEREAGYHGHAAAGRKERAAADAQTVRQNSQMKTSVSTTLVRFLCVLCYTVLPGCGLFDSGIVWRQGPMLYLD